MLNPLNKQVADLTKSFDAMARDVRAKAADAIAEAVLLMESDAKLNTPVNKSRLITGTRGLFDKSKLSGVLFNNVKYAAYQNFGTGKKVVIPQGWHDIAAQFKGTRPPIYPTRATLFFSNAADKGQQELIEELKKIIKNAKLP